MVMVLFLSFMYKTMAGGGTWNGSKIQSLNAAEDAMPKVSLEIEPRQDIKIEKVFGNEEELDELSSQFSLAWHSLKHVRFFFYNSMKNILFSLMLGEI